jgi:predicted MPP superfamily phosphohydrolase
MIIMRKKVFKLLVIILILAVALSGSVEISNFVLTVDDYDFTFKKLPAAFDGYKIVQISDLHNEQFGEKNKRLLRKIEKLEPDIVVMTGDMVDSENFDFSPFYELSRTLAAKYPVYYILGNHEQWLEEDVMLKMLAELKTTGVRILDNEKVGLKKGGSAINLYGIGYYLNYFTNKNEIITVESLEKKVGKVDSEKVNILLAHDPGRFVVYSEWGADITLSGHNHGGAVRLPFIGGVLSANMTFFPEYDAGLFESESHSMVVSRGLGGLRYLNCPSLVLITLHTDVN